MKRIVLLTLCCWMTLLASAATFSTFNSRTDFRDESIYFLMTTRFYDGDNANNVHCWDAPADNMGDPEWRGDFAGLIDRLDYIKALGFTAIWITPVVTNASGYDYHGYHAFNFDEVDKRYETHDGTRDVTFQSVIDAAHARGMKVILDIVLNHTGNFGEANLCPEFRRDWSANQANIGDCMIPLLQKDGGRLPNDYNDNINTQYAKRLAQMKNSDGQNHDTHNYWHHFANFNWDDATRWFAQIAGDCVDLNTENPAVINYLVSCYNKFIAMGVDGFRIDTSGHIARLAFNKGFLPAFTQAGASHAAARGAASTPFFMFGEVCARYSSGICYRDHSDLSPFYYTWKEKTNYAWDDDPTSFDNIVALEGDGCATHVNHQSCWAADQADMGPLSGQRTSQNALLSGNNYHTPDYSQWNNFSIIDFPMHWTFGNAGSAYNMATPDNDKYYNDATYNVVYVDSHDYGPDQDTRYSGTEAQWAENMDLMFTYRGIPCIYYGSEVQFQAGKSCDNGPHGALANTGRAYFGGYITGTVNATNFGEYTATGNAAATLNAPLSKHLIRLNKIRQAIPALRKGQYSRTNCNGSMAFKRRYTNGAEDSFVLVTISGNATFTGLPAGTYVDAITGDTKVVPANGSLTTNGCSGQGNMRIYVLNGPGKIGEDEYYLYSSSRPAHTTPAWDGQQMALTTDPGFSTGGGDGPTVEPTDTIEPCLGNANQVCAFFNSANQAITSNITAHVWGGSKGTAWPGLKATNLGAGYWKVIIPAEYGTPAKIIWSSNGANQTADLDYTNHGVYNGATLTGTITQICDSDDTPEPTPGPTIKPQPEGACRIYYAGSFAAPTIWAWDEVPTSHNYFNTWPGASMTRDTNDYEGQPLWYYEFTDVRPQKCIFSNSGASQTADLNVPDCDYVYVGGEWKPLSGVTAVPQVMQKAAARKLIYRGQVYILRDGAVYDLMGRRVVAL